MIPSTALAVVSIHVPRADYNNRPVFINGNPYTGTFKRNHEGDYHASEDEINAMLRDQKSEGNDGIVLEHYGMEDIDLETLGHYRTMFQNNNPDHVWNQEDNKQFLTMLGGYKKDRSKNIEGLTIAGLLMFGKGIAIRDRFSNLMMDYRDESHATDDMRWSDRVTYDGTWENNLFNFFMKVSPKLSADLKKPFVLDNQQRVDDTPIHKAIREAFVNMIIHSDYLLDSGTLKILKKQDEFIFTNPGSLKLSVEALISDELKISIESANKSANSDKKSANKSTDSNMESADSMTVLTKRQEQILTIMEEGREYTTEAIAGIIGLKGPRTRQLMNELVELGKVESIGTTKDRRYRKK